ncbi:MAG TPA: hypothetical protein VN380_15690 [Thermoanaerobaculia bacterium]|jgi:hypothetical protein|nr:hypothetical protein [Thermoanaerobaculia bacterium]
MLVRRLAFVLFFVAAGAFAQGSSNPPTDTAKKETVPAPPPADKKTPDKASADNAPQNKNDESKQPTGADGSSAPNVTIDVVILPPPPTSADELKARVANAETHEVEARLGDSIILVTKKPDELKAYVDWASNHSKDITLYINGVDTGTTREAIYPTDGALQFHLERTSSNKNLWSALLREPFLNWTRPKVIATIGIDHGAAAPTNAHFTLVVVKFVWYSWLWLIALVLFLVAIFWLAKKHGLLRDGPTVDGVLPPYSLGRCQMAWWFVLIIVSYVLIWLISGNQDTITPSLLGLMGISSGTALGAVLIETSSAGTTAKAPKTSWWLREILSDSDGNIVLHRFQIVVWTIVLGIMFLVSVATQLTMPEFSATLLATMGISSGTYLGFKFPEK